MDRNALIGSAISAVIGILIQLAFTWWESARSLFLPLAQDQVWYAFSVSLIGVLVVAAFAVSLCTKRKKILERRARYYLITMAILTIVTFFGFYRLDYAAKNAPKTAQAVALFETALPITYAAFFSSLIGIAIGLSLWAYSEAETKQ